MITIFYVEDNPSIAQSVTEYLSQQGCEVTVFPTIMLAKNALQVHAPSLILLDWNMPDGDGGAFCQWIRKIYEHLPIIFLTVRADSHDIIEGLGYGADDYMMKPFFSQKKSSLQNQFYKLDEINYF